jgi:hypothetical protein
MANSTWRDKKAIVQLGAITFCCVSYTDGKNKASLFLLSEVQSHQSEHELIRPRRYSRPLFVDTVVSLVECCKNYAYLYSPLQETNIETTERILPHASVS